VALIDGLGLVADMRRQQLGLVEDEDGGVGRPVFGVARRDRDIRVHGRQRTASNLG
jgi:hypothetical protein